MDDISNIKKGKYSLQSLKYTPQIFEKQEPKIYAYPLRVKNDDKDEEKEVIAFTLNYDMMIEINGNSEIESQQVILATLGKEAMNTERLKEIKRMLQEQLIENQKGRNEYKPLERLMSYKNKLELPFKFTMEGRDVLTKDSKDLSYFIKTYEIKEDEDSKYVMSCLYGEEQMSFLEEERMKEKKDSVLERIMINQLWKPRRDLILEKLNETDRELFLRGEKIAELVQENNLDQIMENRKESICEYMLENYANDEELRELADKYIKIKEKAIAIDFKIILEELETQEIEEMANSGKDKTQYNIIRQLENFFDLIKTGRDYNARLLVNVLHAVDLKQLKELISSNNNEEELNLYLDLKKYYISDLQNKSEITLDDYKSKPSVRMLYKFLINAKERDLTRQKEGKQLLNVYELLKQDITNDNIEAFAKYIEYAKESGVFQYDLSKLEVSKNINEQKRIIPNSIKQFYIPTQEEIDDASSRLIY